VWRVSYVIVGSFQVLLALTFFLTRRRWTEVATLGATHERVDPARTRDTLRLPIVWLGMLTFYVYAGVEVVTAQWSFSLMTLQRGVPVATAGLLVGLFWGSLMVGRVLFGLVADRVPLVSTLAACMASAVIGALLFWLEPTRLVSFFGLMLIGFSVAPIFASLISLTPTRVGREHSDNAIGFQIASAGLGGASLTALVGLLATSVGLEVIGVSIVALSGALFVLFGALIRAGRA
jgi:fucose permease